MEKTKPTSFKIKINSISESEISFDLLSGDDKDAKHSNVLKNGNFEPKNDIKMPIKHFKDFAIRLLAHVFLEKKKITDEELRILWNMRIMVFDNESISDSESIFHKEIKRMDKLNLLEKERK